MRTAEPRIQITDPPRYVFTTGTLFPIAFKPSPNTISTKNAGTRLFGTHPVNMHAAVSARMRTYNGSGNPATLKSFILNLSVFFKMSSLKMSSLKTPDRVASVIHGLLQTPDDHVISGPVIHLHMYPVADLMPQKCPSERGLGTDQSL